MSPIIWLWIFLVTRAKNHLERDYEVYEFPIQMFDFAVCVAVCFALGVYNPFEGGK